MSEYGQAVRSGLNKEIAALWSGAVTIGALLVALWVVNQARSGHRAPTGREALAWWLGGLVHFAPWLLWPLVLLLAYAFVRYGVLEAVRWLWLIPRMARERVAFAVLPPADFSPSPEAIAAFTADLLGMRRRVLAWLDREATAMVVGLTTDAEGRPLMYWEFPKRFTKELEAARSFYPGVQLRPLSDLLPGENTARSGAVRRLELKPGKAERYPLQEIPEAIDALTSFAGVLGTVGPHRRLEQRVCLLPVPPPLLGRVRRGMVGTARQQEGRDPLASVGSMGDRFNPAESVERRIERQGLWAKVGKAEPMFRVQILVRAEAPGSDEAGGLVKAVFGAWEEWAGQNYMRSVGWPVMGGWAVLFGSNSWVRRPWFDYRWRTGVVGSGRLLTAWELWPLMKPWRKGQAANARRRQGLSLPAPDFTPNKGKVICVVE